MNGTKQKIIIVIAIFLLVFSGIFIYFGVRKSNGQPTTLPEDTSVEQDQNIQNIIFDHSKKKAFVVNQKDQRTEILKDIKFTDDDLFLNIGNNQIVLYNYTGGSAQTSLPVSTVYKVENNKLEPSFQVKDQKIFWFIDKDNYGYSTSNSSFFKWKGADIETTRVYNLGYKTNRSNYSSFFSLQTDGSRVNELTANDSYITTHRCVYCGLDTIITAFLVADNYQVYGGLLTDTQMPFLRFYERENPNTQDHTEEGRNDSKLVKENSVDYAPTLLSLRGKDLYYSSVVSKNNFRNYKTNMDDFSAVELKNYGQSEEIVY